MAKSIKDMCFQPSDLLSHARSLFEYHATQRLNSNRYFILAYSLFAAAYSGFIRGENFSLTDLYTTWALCVVAAIITLIFFGLERRNEELVEINELALRELEGAAAAAHESSVNNLPAGTNHKINSVEWRPFEITANASIGLKDRYEVRYGALVKLLYFVLFAVSLLATVPPAIKACDAASMSETIRGCLKYVF